MKAEDYAGRIGERWSIGKGRRERQLLGRDRANGVCREVMDVRRGLRRV